MCGQEIQPAPSELPGPACFATRSRSGMRFPIDVEQLGGIHVCVALCRTEPGMAEQFLNCAQIGASLEKMRRKRVAQRVRADTGTRTEG